MYMYIPTCVYVLVLCMYYMYIYIYAMYSHDAYRDGEVPRLGHAVLAREDGLDVPGDDEVDDGVDEQHHQHVQHRELVVNRRARSNVRPLDAATCRHARTCMSLTS